MERSHWANSAEVLAAAAVDREVLTDLFCFFMLPVVVYAVIVGRGLASPRLSKSDDADFS